MRRPKHKSQLKANLSQIPDNDTSAKSWMKRHVWGIYTTILLVLGITLSAGSIAYGVERQHILSNGTSAIGTIDSIYTKIDGPWAVQGDVPQIVDYKKVSFLDSKTSARHSFDIRTKSGDVVGKKQSVTYLSEDPTRAAMTGEGQFKEMAYKITIPIFTMAVLLMIWLPKKFMSSSNR